MWRILRMNYKAYLHSQEWQEIRRKVFNRALKNANSNNLHGVCEKCGYEPYKPCLQVHHKSYGEDMNRLDNLILLCPRCHKKEHAKGIVNQVKRTS